MVNFTVTLLESWLPQNVPQIVCVQETKLSVINDFDVMQCLSPGFDYFFLPTD
jgi:exonuclease III